MKLIAHHTLRERMRYIINSEGGGSIKVGEVELERLLVCFPLFSYNKKSVQREYYVY